MEDMTGTFAVAAFGMIMESGRDSVVMDRHYEAAYAATGMTVSPSAPVCGVRGP